MIGRNYLGSVTVVVNPDGTIVATACNALQRPTSRTDEPGHIATMGYDSVGNLLTSTDATVRGSFIKASW